MIEQWILVRHGETVHNVAGVTQGWSDSALSEAGARQIKTLGARLRRYEPTALYSSPLPRALTTAKAIGEVTGLEIHQLDDLREMNYGDWEGRSFLDIRAQEKDAFRRFVDDPASACPGGESHVDVRERMRRAFETISSNGSQSRVIVVSHGTAIRVSVSALLNVDLAVSRNFVIDNASISVFTRRGDRYLMKLWNDTTHCEEG